jgi:hypothetical protein
VKPDTDLSTKPCGNHNLIKSLVGFAVRKSALCGLVLQLIVGGGWPYTDHKFLQLAIRLLSWLER